MKLVFRILFQSSNSTNCIFYVPTGWKNVSKRSRFLTFYVLWF